MRKYYMPQDINKTTISEVSGKLCKEFGYQNNLLKQVNENLINNFFKCAKWIEENCPSLNGEFRCRHQPYHWTKLIVENGKAYLEYGSHGYSFEIALSTTETAYKSTVLIWQILMLLKMCSFSVMMHLKNFYHNGQHLNLKLYPNIEHNLIFIVLTLKFNRIDLDNSIKVRNFVLVHVVLTLF